MFSRIFNKTGYRTISLLTSPFFLALIITLALSPFYSDYSKYSLIKVNSGVTDKSNSLEYIFDLNNNGIPEKIILFNSKLGKAAVKVMNSENEIIGWWDFKGIASTDVGLIADYDSDQHFEFYFLSCENDSLLIHQLRYTKNDGYEHISKMLGKTREIDGKVDYQVGAMDSCDIQQDHYKEISISLNAGYSLQPRKLFLWDIHNDTILQGPDMGVNAAYKAVNIDNDPYPEFIASSYSTDNIPDTANIPYHDRSSWIIVLDHTLKFYFPPIENPGHKTSVSLDAIQDGENSKLIALIDYTFKGKPSAKLQLLDLKGKSLNSKDLENHTRHSAYTFIQPFPEKHKQCTLVEIATGNSLSIDINLNTKTVNPIPANSNFAFKADLDYDGKEELIYRLADYESLIVTRSDNSFGVAAKIPFSREKQQFSLIRDSIGYPLLFVQTGDNELWLKYKINPYFKFRYLIWLGILGIITLIIYLIRWQYSITQNRKKLMAEQIASMQLSLLSRHLDPHFTFNTLNTISSFIYKENKDEAYAMFSKFTALIRYTMEHSASFDTTLREELDFLETYLGLQQKRYGNAFDYEIIVPAEVELERKVPRLLLQQYAENSIKHGLRDLDIKGKLTIDMNMKGKSLNIDIIDNGRGRKQALYHTGERKGTGLKTMESIYLLFSRLTGTSVVQTIEDLVNSEGLPAGTKINLKVVFP